MKFAANLSMMFGDVDVMDRIARARDAGFKAVEIQFPYQWSAQQFGQALKDNDLDLVLFNMPAGNWQAGERGLAALPGRQAEFLDSVSKALLYADELSCPRLHCMVGLRDETVTLEQQFEILDENLKLAADACLKAGVTLMIEPLNRVDCPNYLLNDFDLAERLIRSFRDRVDEGLGLQFDIYHCERIHGDTAARIVQLADITAHYQIAGTPDRREPDRGTLPLHQVMQAVAQTNPDLWIGCEYHSDSRTKEGLGWLQDFS